MAAFREFHAARGGVRGRRPYRTVRGRRASATRPDAGGGGPAGRGAASRLPRGDVGIRTATVEDAAALDHAFEGVAAVINGAGPFLDTAEAVASAALRAGAHYIDVSAEQPSAETVFDRFDEPARAVGLVALPAMGFYGGFADLLATAAMGDWAQADEIRMRSMMSMTPSTRSRESSA